MDRDPICRADAAGYYGSPDDGLSSATRKALPRAAARRRLNAAAIIQAILLPCGIFTGSLLLLSFSVRHDHAGAVAFMVVCGFSISLVFAQKAYALRRREALGEELEPSWFLFLAVTCLTASIGGLLLGDENYSLHTARYFDYASMGLATDVDPSAAPGQRHLDASRLVFRPGTVVMEGLSASFKDTDAYCVAPVAAGNQSAPPAFYDYFAVGINCCSLGAAGEPPKFWCGSGDRAARGGLRWMGDGRYFWLAVRQAQAQHHYATRSPILFEWTEDPVGWVDAMRAKGVQYARSWALAHAVVQTLLALVLAAGHTPQGAKAVASLSVASAGVPEALSKLTSEYA